ncbi:MAG: GAF domain-containing protein, partial [Chloroflexota bacterium]
RRFTLENISLLDSIALQAAQAIQNARLFENARASQTFLKSIIDEIPDAIFIKDREHKWVVVNRAFAHGVVGQPEEKLIGRTDHDYLPQEVADDSWARDAKMFETGQIQEIERPNIDPTGKVSTVHSRKIPLTLNNTDGSPDYLIGIIMDITERKEREAERERLIEETQQILERTQSLYRLSHALTTSTDPRTTLEAVLDEYLHLLKLKQGSIMLLNKAGEFSQVQALCVDGRAVEPGAKIMLRADPVTRHLLQHPDPLIIENIQTHALTKGSPNFRPVPTEAMLVIPLEIQDKMAGVITAETNQAGHFFAPNDVALGEAIADQLGIWLENRQLLAEAQYRSDLLQTAAEVSGVAGSILEEEALINTSVNLIRDKFDFYYVGLFLLDEAKEWAMLRAGTGEAGRIQLERGHRLRVGGESMIGWSVDNRQAKIALDVGEERVHFQNPYLPNTHSEMALPLISQDEVIGALTVQSVERGAFSNEDITVLQTMANQLANALTNARLYKVTQSAARREAIIREISGKIRSSVNVDDIMKTTVTELSKILGTSRGGITLKMDETDPDQS